ncbi:hypothetical protein YPPY53_1825, partial [Yersinia pestis PY-53]
MAAVLSIEP